MVNDRDVDVVHICVPNHLHHKMCLVALEAGKHVVCEKPLAVTHQEAAELVEALGEKNLVGAVNYNLRYYPLCHEARKRIRLGEIGDVRLIHGQYLQDWLFYPTDWNWRLDPMLGGKMRAVADIGTHWFDMVTWLTGLRITAVMADISTVIPTRYKPQQAVETFASQLSATDNTDQVEVQTEDYAAVLLQFDNGARGVVTISQVSAGHKNRFQWEIDGARSSLGWQQEQPNSLWVGHRDKSNEVLTKDPGLMHEDVRDIASYPGGHAEGYPDTFKQLFKAVYKYIAEGNFNAPPTFPTFVDGYMEIVLCEAIQRSAIEKRWVEINEQTAV
jgi:predicted dehydrogenase